MLTFELPGHPRPVRPARTVGNGPFVSLRAENTKATGAAQAVTEIARAQNGQLLVVPGTAALPSYGFLGDANTGFFRHAAEVIGVTNNGAATAFFDAGNNFYLGSPNDILGMGAARVSSQGTGTTGGAWNLVKFGANAVGAGLAMGKSRGATVDSYTIVNSGDILANLEFWGSDGAAMVMGARIQGFNIGTPALGDVRAGLRFLTGSGVGATANRLTIDDTTIAALLPITTTGSILSLGAGGIGYGPGGGAVVQTTSKATGVTLNEASGRITTNAAALAANSSVEFTLTCSEIGIEDHVGVTLQSPVSKYTAVVVGKTPGSCTIRLTNYTAGSLSEAVVMNYAVNKVSIT